MKICIVTTEYPSASLSGGIGTYAHTLGQLLKEDNEVTVLIVSEHVNTKPLKHVKGIQFVTINQLNHRDFSGGVAINYKVSLSIFDWLTIQNFDHINFPDWLGLGFASVQAKFTGIAFTKTILSVTLHGMSSWTHFTDSSVRPPLSDNQIKIDYMESYAIQNADIVISPTNYMKNWISEKKIVTKREVIVLTNPIISGSTKEITKTVKSAKKIIFMGRIEKRKGIELFLEALSDLQHTGEVELIIIGRSLSGYSPIDEAKLQEKFLKFSLYENLTTEQALEICNEDNCLIVIPSLIENCPYVVQELISQNSRILATKVGGIPELLNSENLVEPNASDLQSSMQKFLEDSNSISKASPVIDHKLLSMNWINLFKNKIDFSVESQFQYRNISVIIAHYNQSKFLEAALDSVARQTYSQFEVIVIDDGSDLRNRTEFNSIAKKWEGEKFKFLFQENQDVGFTRNRGVKESNSEVICFLDADDLLEETALECFMRAMNSGAEISTSHFAIFLDEHEGIPKSKGLYGAYEPMGPITELMWKENILGGANFAIQKKLFSSLGGFTEVRKSNHQDWQFLTKAVLLGSDLRVIPKRLLNYRVTDDSMARTRSHIQGNCEVIDRYTENAPSETIRELANEMMKAYVYSTTSADKIQFISSTFRLAQRLQKLAVAISPYGSFRWKVLLPLYRRIVK